MEQAEPPSPSPCARLPWDFHPALTEERLRICARMLANARRDALALASYEMATIPVNHTFRATGITAYPKNGGTLENAAAMANHVSTCTTQFCNRRRDEISLDEVGRIRL